MKKCFLLLAGVCCWQLCYCWGFYAHQKINYYAVFLLPPQLLQYFKPHIGYLSEHAVDPDKRRYLIAAEGPRHYIDLDHYGQFPFDSLPRNWNAAAERYTVDTLQQHGVVPWWILVMHRRLTEAMKNKNGPQILKLAAEIGHYIGDAHVPLHTSSNHNGQKTGQHGIHGFWEGRVPELLAPAEWDFFMDRAAYLDKPSSFIWSRVLESARAVDSVLLIEKELTSRFPADKKYVFEYRNGKIIRQYSSAFTIAYDRALRGMVQRRMREAVFAVASFWYTAWIDAGQPTLESLQPPADDTEMNLLNEAWKKGEMLGRKE